MSTWYSTMLASDSGSLYHYPELIGIFPSASNASASISVLLFVSSYAFSLFSEGTAWWIPSVLNGSNLFVPINAIFFFSHFKLNPRIFNRLQTVLWEITVNPYCLKSLHISLPSSLCGWLPCFSLSAFSIHGRTNFCRFSLKVSRLESACDLIAAHTSGFRFKSCHRTCKHKTIALSIIFLEEGMDGHWTPFSLYFFLREKGRWREAYFGTKPASSLERF
jgi:hypothetical protein